MALFSRAPYRLAKGSSRHRSAAGAVGRMLVTRCAGQSCVGKLLVGPQVIACALGRSGITHRKREGDGATPAGSFGLADLRLRVDRVPRPRTGLPARPIRRHDGWCDDPALAQYNSPIRLPARGSHEELWRKDRLYDLVVVLDFNLRHPVSKRGSAIFLHVADPSLAATAGCVAIRSDALRRLLPRLSARSRMTIQG